MSFHPIPGLNRELNLFLLVFIERTKTALVNASLAGKTSNTNSVRDLKTIFGLDGDDSDSDEEPPHTVDAIDID